MIADQREAPRCEIKGDKVQIVIRPIKKTYPIKNISTGGLAFEYSPVKDEPVESESVDIISTDYSQLYLSKIACKTVYDITTLMEGRSFKGGAMRIRGLRFVELTKEQEQKINSLLNYCFDCSA
jgi:hypothetical protein